MTRRISTPACALALAALFFGCDDNSMNTTSTSTVDQSFADTKAKGSVFVLLRDQVTGEAIANAQVSLLGADSVRVLNTDSSGYAMFKGLLPGKRILKIEKPGYAGKFTTADLVDGASDVPRLQDLSFDMSLPRLGATISGKVYFQDKFGNSIPLIAATLDLYFKSTGGENWVSGHKTIVADSSGVYKVDSLPEDVDMTVQVRSKAIDANVYASAETRNIGALKLGEARYLPVFKLTPNIEAFALLADNLDAVTEADTLKLTFSLPVDTTVLQKGDIAVANGGTDVGIVPVWSDGGRKLSIRPFAGKWISGTNDLVLNLKSALGVELSEELAFVATSVSSLPKQAGSLSAKASVFGKDTNQVNSGTASVTFKWTRAQGAEGYDLYKKAKGNNAYLWLAKTNSVNDTVLVQDVTDFFDKGDTVSFAVVAFNSKGSAPFSGAPLLTLTDAIRPKLLADPGELAPDSATADNLESTKDTANFGKVTFTFSETMDTLQRPELTYENQNGTKVERDALSIVWTWKSASVAELAIGVLPAKNASAIDTKIGVGLAAFRDQNGNLFMAPTQADWTSILVKVP
ncbi:MAG: hypothetical protein RL173_2575 [Fibrobacterota bacterium]|jgi:hypothetical protein